MTDRPYITCRELIGFIADYLDGTLPDDARSEFDRHLAVCPSCVAYLDGYKDTIRLGREALAAPDDPASTVAPEALVRAVLQARRAR